ncbi:hypothetical protein CP49_22020 [Bradyrhizobium valentinum]|uniref:Uncharacterized protein n=2 Tax=Bradyrhizobium valentinum TaxID=1518501 RepID=A0A0R3M0X6_9BRAD|nr:hypothetical protein CP49_22020 [Bradyrhizobium valentinum]
MMAVRLIAVLPDSDRRVVFAFLFLDAPLEHRAHGLKRLIAAAGIGDAMLDHEPVELATQFGAVFDDLLQARH